MYVGQKYEATRGETNVQLAKRMRDEIKQLIKYNVLKLPAGAEVRVHSNVGTIKVTVYGMTEDQIFEPQDADDIECFRRREYTANAEKIKTTLEKVHGQYQRDDSDVQFDHFDRRYYGHVDFLYGHQAEWRAKWNAEAATRRAELAAEKAEAAKTPLYARKTREGVEVLARADDHRVAMVRPGQLYRWVKPMDMKIGDVEYLLGKVGFESVRYDRATKTFAVRRKVAA